MAHWNIKELDEQTLVFEYLMGDVFYFATHYKDNDAYDTFPISNHKQATQFENQKEKFIERAEEFNKRLTKAKHQKQDEEWSDIIKRNVQAVRNSATQKSIQGFLPHVPNSILNLPKSMISSLPTKKLNSKPITIYINLCENAGVSSEQINSMGISAYYLLKILETMGYQINLKLLTMSKDSKNSQFYYYLFVIPLKSTNTKITTSLFSSFFQNYSQFFRGQLFYVYAEDLRNKNINYSKPYSEAFCGTGLGQSTKEPSNRLTRSDSSSIVLTASYHNIPEKIRTFKDVLQGVEEYSRCIKDVDMKKYLKQTISYLKKIPEAQ